MLKLKITQTVSSRFIKKLRKQPISYELTYVPHIFPKLNLQPLTADLFFVPSAIKLVALYIEIHRIKFYLRTVVKLEKQFPVLNQLSTDFSFLRCTDLPT